MKPGIAKSTTEYPTLLKSFETHLQFQQYQNIDLLHIIEVSTTKKKYFCWNFEEMIHYSQAQSKKPPTTVPPTLSIIVDQINRAGTKTNK